MRRKIGTLVLAEPTVFTRTYETASWYTKIEVPAGEYEITAVVRDGKVSSTWGDNPRWSLPGTVVASYFVNRLFTASSSEVDRNVGNSDTYVSGTYGYALAGIVAENDGSSIVGGGRVVLDDDIEARETSRYMGGANDEERILYGLFVKEGAR